jgi:PKD repeat protein
MLWNFGDGTTSTEQNPTHIFTVLGTYTVTLTVTNAGGTDSEVKTGYIIVSQNHNPIWAANSAWDVPNIEGLSVTSFLSPVLLIGW